MFEPFKKYLFPIGIAVLIIAFLFFNDRDADNTVSRSEPDTEEQPDALKEEDQSQAKVMVDVKGEVATPGVYEIESESRVNEVIQMAGGFTQDADQTMVNLAQKVQDEMVVMIPALDDDNPNSAMKDSGSDKVRINRASQEEIEGLNGIGPSKAAAIIQFRDENGAFQTADDLLEVSGIGEKTLESLKENIQVP